MTSTHSDKREHAVVLGGSIAGLFAARVLSNHFQRVTIIERDPVNDEPESRKGQPQARHLHGVLEPTRRFINTYLPGINQALIDGGAVVGDFGQLVRWHHFGGYKINCDVGLEGMALSRPFLEWHVRRGVMAQSNITLRANTAAEELIASADRSRITGVKIARRVDNNADEIVEADLIVDASGRGSQTPRWLTAFGYESPEEQEVKIRFGYATRIYRREPDDTKDFGTFMIAPTPPDKHGAYLFPMEGMRWIVTAGGYLGDHPPSDEVGFMDFIRNLDAPDIYNILSRAEPLSDIVTYNYPSSRRRRYDKLSRFPDGYLVIGDAVASFNPIYGQGMSSAAMQVETLSETLKVPSLQGSWRSFFSRTAKVIDLPWQLAVGEDFRYAETEGKRPLGINLINRYVARVHRATHHDPVVYAQFVKVMHLIASPMSLMQPHILWRVFRTRS